MFQSQANIEVAYKAQSALGSPASGAGATVFRPSGGQGLSMTKALIQSNEVRRDGQETRGRHGSRQVPGTYEGELSLGSFDAILEAIQRGTFDAGLTIDQTEMTSITTTTNTIVAAGGSWIAEGLRVGDIIRLSNHSTAGNNGRNLRITGLTASTITVAETLTADASADTSFTVTRPKKLVNPGAGNLVERYFTVAEREVDIDAEELFTDCKFSSFRLQMQPNGMVLCTIGLMGLDMTTESGTSSPTFTSPAITTSLPMAVTDAVIRLGDGDVIDITALEFELGLSPQVPPVLGNGGKGVDVFLGNLAVSNASVTLLRQDLQRVQDYIDETPMRLWINCVENESEPKDFCSFFFGNVTLGGNNKSAINKAGGPRTATVPMQIGVNEGAGSQYDATTLLFQTSAA